MSSIQIFKPIAKGQSLTSMEGVSVSFGAAELQDIATAYNPALHEAPLVIGHPTHDAPAYGWVKSLRFADGSLMADCEQSPELGELVAKRHYKKVSASFYQPQAPGNPTPGKWALRHVGFLGAQAPGVKGLKAVSFAETEEGVVTFGELPGYTGGYIARLFGNLRDWLIAKEGQETADRVLSSWDVESIRSASQRADEAVDADDTNEISGATPALSFAEPGQAATFSQPANPTETAPMKKTPEELQAALDVAQAQINTMQAAEVQRAADARHAAHVSFAEGLVNKAVLPAAIKDVIVATLDHLAQPSGIVSFGEGDAAKPLAVVLQEQLQAMPPSVSFSEFAQNGGAGDQSASAIAAKAVAYQDEQAAKGIRVNTAEAVSHVSSL